MYKAIIAFIDAETRREYKANDKVDVSGMTKERLRELTSSSNATGMPVIQEVEDTKENKHGENS